MNISEQAQTLHSRSVVIDSHSDTMIENYVSRITPGFAHPTDRLHMDLERSLAGGLTCAFFMVGGNAQPRTWELVDLMHREVEANADRMTLALCAQDIRRAKAEGKLAGLMSFEGGRAFGGDLALLRNFYRLGVRCMSITHGEGGSEADQLQGEKSFFGFCDMAAREQGRKCGKGLTEFGRGAVKEMNRLGTLIDAAHCNDRSLWDLIELSDAPIVYTHGNCYALSPHSRNLTDDALKALGDKGGVIGVAFFPKFIDEHEPSLSRLVDHIEHIIEVAGVDAAGVGTDFDGMGATTPIIPEVSRLPELTQAMLDRGFPPADIEKILGGNWLRVIQEVVG